MSALSTPPTHSFVSSLVFSLILQRVPRIYSSPLSAFPSSSPNSFPPPTPSIRNRRHSREPFSSHLRMYAFLRKCFRNFLQLQRKKQSYSYLGIILLSTLGIKFPPTFLGPCFNFHENIFQIQLPVGITWAAFKNPSASQVQYQLHQNLCGWDPTSVLFLGFQVIALCRQS